MGVAKSVCYEESFGFSVGCRNFCRFGFTNRLSSQPGSGLVVVEAMFASIVNSAQTTADSHPGAKPKNHKTQLAVRRDARGCRGTSWIIAPGAHQLEDSKGESTERQKRDQKKYDFVTALHN